MPPNYDLHLHTRTRREIPNERRPERAVPALRAARELIEKLHPDARFRSISGTYNCVGLVLATRRTWVGPELLVWILREDGYVQLRGEADSSVGDVVVYRDDDGNATHVAVATERRLVRSDVGQDDSLWVMSKWGADGEYFHWLRDVPELFGTQIEFWSERRSP